MLEALPKPDAYRTTQQIGELQIKIEMTTQRVLHHIDKARKQIDDLKAEISNRWKNTEGLLPAERNRVAQHETASRAREIIKSVQGILDLELKHAFQLQQEVLNAKAFYPNKLQYMMNVTVGAADRARYCTVIASAGPVELMGYAGHALATQDMSLGAAVVQANDTLPNKDRRFVSGELADLITIPAWDSLQMAFKYSDTQFQQAVLAIRVFQSAKSSPVSTLHLAKLEGKTKLNEDGSMKTEGELASPFTQS